MSFKKISAILAAGALAACLTACSGNGGTTATDAPDTAADASSYTLLTDGVLTIASSPDYPPFENLEGDEIVGYEVDLWNAVAENLGLTVEVRPMQFDAIIPAIVAGGQADVGVSGFTVTPERAKEIDFTASFYTDDQAIGVMKGSDITAENVDEALNSADITIAAQSGTTGESFAKENFPKATVVGYGSSNDCFAAVQAGKADAVITNDAVVAKMLEAYSDAVIVKEIATGEEYAMVISQDNPGLTAAINGALADLAADGTIDKIMDKWFS